MTSRKSQSISMRIEQAHANLVADIYDSVADPTVWMSFLQRLVQAMDARSARLLVLDREAKQVMHRVAINHDDHYLQQYADHYVNTCPWRPELASKMPGRMYSSYTDFSCSQKEFLKSPFFNEWARPQNIHHGMLGTVYMDANSRVQLMLQREDKPGHFTEQDKALVSRFLPHIQRACELRSTFEQGIARTDAIVRSAEQVRQPFIVLNEFGMACYVSPSAESLLARTRSVRLLNHRLQIGTPEQSSRFDAQVRESVRAAAGAWHYAGGTQRLTCPELGELHVSIVPMPVNLSTALFLPIRGFATVFLHAADAGLQISHERLMQLFGMTAAEADLAKRLAQGASLQEAGQARGITESTARTLLKRVFEKLAINRQAELVRIVLLSSAVEGGTAPPG